MSKNPFVTSVDDNPPSSPVRSRPERPPPPRPRRDVVAPPAYDEATGSRPSSGEYPREKPLSSRSRQISSSPTSHRDSRSSIEKRSEHRSERRSEHRSERRPEHRSEHRSDRTSEPRKHSLRARSHSDTTKLSSKPGHKHLLLKKKIAPEVLKSKNLDSIDKLDVTAFFGGGFHHDGPFDACTPHRNKNVKAAPVMAYAIDGPNNCIKGVSAVPDQAEQMKLAFGTYQDDEPSSAFLKNQVSPSPFPAYAKYTEPPSSNASIINFDSTRLAEPVHGPATAGLGSTTFVDGAPAPRNAQEEGLGRSTMGRKKSIVQRLRRNSGANANATSAAPPVELYHENSYQPVPEVAVRHTLNQSDDFAEERGTSSSLLRRVKSLKVSRK